MSSIKDVARLAGVSYTTVSHVINGTRKVSAAARERVLQAVAECGYVPSEAARSLRGAPSRVLGVLVPDVSDPFCAEITLGAERAAAEAGYSVVLTHTHPGRWAPDGSVNALLGRRIDGLLVVAGLFDHAALLQRLNPDAPRRTLPMVFIDHDPAPVLADSLSANAEAEAHTAVSYLLSLGHRRIACISGPAGMPVSEARVRGWRNALADAAVTPSPEWLVQGDFGVVSGHRAAERLLRAGADRPTAIFACNDLMAMGVLRAAAQQHIGVPQALSVVGVDGIMLGEYVHPTLTTVGESLPDVGVRAVRSLLQRIQHGGKGPAQRMARQPMLIQRESAGSCPA